MICANPRLSLRLPHANALCTQPSAEFVDGCDVNTAYSTYTRLLFFMQGLSLELCEQRGEARRLPKTAQTTKLKVKVCGHIPKHKFSLKPVKFGRVREEARLHVTRCTREPSSQAAPVWRHTKGSTSNHCRPSSGAALFSSPSLLLHVVSDLHVAPSRWLVSSYIINVVDISTDRCTQ